MRALVTGGAGFIGSVLVERLVAEGHEVDVIDDLSTGSLSNLADARSDRTGSLRIHQADLRSSEVTDLIARRTPEVVFHLAARPDLAGAVDDAETNLVGSLRVLAGARGAAAKVVYAGDATAMYGDVEGAAEPVRESHAPVPQSAFGVSNRTVLEHLRLAREAHGLEFTALAFSTVYGPRDREGVVGQLVSAVLDRVAVPVPDGHLDLLYVDDAVDALVRAAGRGGGLLCNVGSGVAARLGDVFRAAAIQAGLPEAPSSPGRPTRGVLVDAGRARIHLGWSPWTPLDEGLAHTLRWWSTHP